MYGERTIPRMNYLDARAYRKERKAQRKAYEAMAQELDVKASQATDKNVQEAYSESAAFCRRQASLLSYK